MTAASVTLAAICIAITLFSLTVAAVAVRMARKEIAHSRNVVALNRQLTERLGFWTAPLPNSGSGLGQLSANSFRPHWLNPDTNPLAPYTNPAVIFDNRDGDDGLDV